MSIFIISVNTSFESQLIQFFFTTKCFDHLWASSGSFYNNVHGKEYVTQSKRIVIRVHMNVKCSKILFALTVNIDSFIHSFIH